MKKRIFSILLTLALVLSLGLITALPAVAAVPGSVQFITEGSGTAAWSTAAFKSGSNSVLLTATNPYNASVGIPVNIPLAGITQLSFWYNQKTSDPATGHVLGPDMVLILQNGAQYYVAGRGGAVASVGAWLEADPITPTNFAASSVWWYGTFDGTNYGSLTPVGGCATFAALKAETVLMAATVLYAAVNLDPPGAGSTGSVYVDDITVNNVPYDLEPSGSGPVDLTSGSAYSTYAFGYTVPAPILVATNYVVPVAFATKLSGGNGYGAVRFSFEKTGPGNVTFTAKDSNNVEFTFTNSGVWGPAGGFPLPALYNTSIDPNATTPWTLNFSAVGAHTITFNCYEIGQESNPFATGSVVVTVSPPLLGISVTPTTINFGSIKPGVASTGQTVIVKNIGNVAADFSATLTNISTPDVYTTGLKLSGSSVSNLDVPNVAPAGTVSPSLVLTIPMGTAPGTYTATLIFWAE